MRDSWERNFRTKDGRQEALTGCSRSSETRAQWTDVRAAADREVPVRMKTLTRWTICFWVKRTSPEFTAQSVKCHRRQAFLSDLLSASHERICSWNALRRRVQELTDANCTARKLLLKKFSQFAADFIVLTDEKVFTVAAAVNELWKSVDFTELKLIK